MALRQEVLAVTADLTVFQSPFRLWRLHWFECPACGHRSWNAVGSVEITLNPRQFVARFQCDKCAQHSLQRTPLLVAAVVLLTAFVLFAISYQILTNLPFEMSLLHVVLLLGSLATTSFLVSVLIGRMINRYDSIEKS